MLVCGALLLWIFHSIFTREAKTVALKQGIHWEQLSRTEQWETAWRLGPAELWHVLSAVHLGWFALSLVAVGVTVFIGIIRWRMVLAVQGLKLSFWRATEISFVAQFFNTFLLGSTGGDLIKAYYAARETHHKKTEAVTTVFVDRLIGLWGMLFFAGLMMIPNARLLLDHESLGATALAVLGMLVACSTVLTVAFWGGLSKRWPKARELLRRLPKGDALERSLDSCRTFGGHKKFLSTATLLSLVINVFCVLHAIILAKGLGLTISPVAMFVIVPIVVCISALPITPAGLGVRENLFVMMLTAPEINISDTSALSLSLLVYAGGLFWSVVGGFVYLCVRDKDHLAELTHATPEDK